MPRDRQPWRAVAQRSALPILEFVSVVIIAAAFALAGSPDAVAGEPRAKGASVQVDTEHLFGFTQGSDIGEAGETELEADSTGRFGKRAGSYNAAGTSLEAKFTLSDSVLIAPTATIAYYDIGQVPGFDD